MVRKCFLHGNLDAPLFGQRLDPSGFVRRSADYGEFQTLGNADIALCQAAPMQSDPEPNGLTLAGIG